MKRLNVVYQGERVGQLLDSGSGIYFEYDVIFLRRGLELSPFNLPSRKGVFGPFPSFLRGLPGLVSDSLPDSFGMKVMERRFEELGRPKPSPLGMLAYQGNRTMGALTYEPVEGEEDNSIIVDLAKSADSARRIVDHKSGKIEKALIASASTAGGAQPKILAGIHPETGDIRTGSGEIAEGMEAWIIKLTTGDDVPRTTGAVEFGYFRMAEEAGLIVPDTKLIEDSEGVAHFAIRRFDREDENPNSRIHSHTYAGLMHLDYREPDQDYRDLLNVTLALTKDQRDITALFRQIVFNLAVHNQDDHAKNFSFLMDSEGRWSFAPAYDLVFCSNEMGGNWMSIEGRRTGITTDHLITLGRDFGLQPKEVVKIVDQVAGATEGWLEIAEKAGVFDSYASIIDMRMRDLRKSLCKRERLSP